MNSTGLHMQAIYYLIVEDGKDDRSKTLLNRHTITMT